MILHFEHLEAHVVQHGDPEPHGVGGDHVGVMVPGKQAVVKQCHAVYHFLGLLFWHWMAQKTRWMEIKKRTCDS